MEGVYAFADEIKIYKAILDATQEIQNWLRYHSGKSNEFNFRNSIRPRRGIKIWVRQGWV